MAVAGITADSRAVAPGFVFAALPSVSKHGGHKGAAIDGRDFIADAVARGACAVLSSPGTVWPPGVPPRPLIEDPEPRRRLALIAAELAGPQPARTVAITGTNGKTSCAEFLRQIWAARGQKAASLGTLGLIAPGFPPGAGLTTPDPVSLATTLAALRRDGIEHVAIEASSHGLDQFRLDGLRLAAGAFTNLTRDHLDYHGDMAAYRRAKLRLFGALLPRGAPAIAAAAMDAETLAAMRDIAEARGLGFEIAGDHPEAAYRLLRVIPRPDGQDIEILRHGRKQTITLPLPGRFQAENALLAALLADRLGDVQAGSPGEGGALDALPRLTGVRGRLERAAVLPNGAAVYVDYAHTPDALVRLLTALRPHAAGRLHVVFGAGGDRDPGKRPLMGQAAAAHADHVIITDDNPRGEDPAAIRAAVLAGAPGATDGGSREHAIARALEGLGPADVLVVAGKGHEQGQTIGRETLPFDDVSVIRRLAGVP